MLVRHLVRAFFPIEILDLLIVSELSLDATRVASFPTRVLLRRLRLDKSNVLVIIHAFGLLDVKEELLGVAPDLSSGARLDELFDQLPVFAVQAESYKRYAIRYL